MVKWKEDIPYGNDDKIEILEQLKKVLKKGKHQVEVKLVKHNKIEFIFDKRIFDNQIDLIEFFTVIRYIDFRPRNKGTLVATIKAGYKTAAQKVFKSED